MASKRGVRRKQCGHKVGHKTRSAANAARFHSCSRAELAVTSSYKCLWCGKWHWGHFTRKGKR